MRVILVGKWIVEGTKVVAGATCKEIESGLLHHLNLEANT
jgi:hypothetical protein